MIRVGTGFGKGHIGLAAAGFLVLLSSCGKDDQKAPSNFDVGTQPLKLYPAPGQLCGGDGAQKDCATPGGCQSELPSAGSTGSTTGSQAGSSGYNGAAPAQEAIFDSPGDYDDSSYDDVPPGGVMPGGEETMQPIPDELQPPLDPSSDEGLPSPVDGGPVLSDAGSSNRDSGIADDGGAGFTDAAAPMSRDSGASAVGSDAGADVPDGPVDAGALMSEPQLESQLSSRRLQQLEFDLDEACELADDSKAATLYLSADDSNSTASPVIARRLIQAGGRVPAAIIRPYEFLNYYDFSFEPARAGEVRIVPQLSSCPVDNQLNLQVALSAEQRDPTDRRPLNLTLVVDTSGSMVGTPLSLARSALSAMATQFQKGDLVSLIFWNAAQDVRLNGHEIAGPNDSTFLSQVDQLVADGGTNLYAGLVAGYSVATENRASDRINRVIMISDGGANIGVTDEQLISSYADDEDGEEGIYLAGIGVGEGYNDLLMNSVTDAGRGSYVYLDSAAEADRMLGERFLQVIDVAAREVRLELTLPWYMQVTKFFGEHISTDRNLVKPQHLAPNSAMVFFQVLEACDPSLLNGDDRIQMRATWTRPFSRESRSATINTTLNELAGNDDEIEKAAVIAGYAEALANVEGADVEVGREILRTAYEDVINAPGADEDPDLIEVSQLLARYAGTYYGIVLTPETVSPADAGLDD